MSALAFAVGAIAAGGGQQPTGPDPSGVTPETGAVHTVRVILVGNDREMLDAQVSARSGAFEKPSQQPDGSYTFETSASSALGASSAGTKVVLDITYSGIDRAEHHAVAEFILSEGPVTQVQIILDGRTAVARVQNQPHLPESLGAEVAGGVAGPPGSNCCVANGGAGCDDPECETIVCAIDSFCCDFAWDQLCADAAVANCEVCSGGGGGDEVCDPADQAGCQLPDTGVGQGAGGVLAAFSSQANSTQDDFSPTASGTVTTVCWWGIYFDGVGATCSPTGGDNFEITYYNDAAGLPGGVHAGPFSVAVMKVNLGIPILFLTEWQFTASHPGVSVTAGNCYWIGIYNNIPTGCIWGWESAPPGNAQGAQNGGATDYDLAYCLDVAFDTANCGGGGGGPVCGPGAGDCFVANGTPGCDDVECCEAVCAVDAFCCDVSWDSICADEANNICNGGGGGPCGPGAGDCFVSNGTPGCDDVDCCEAVCAIDPFCCDVSWDSICASEAANNPACGGGGGGPENDDCENAIPLAVPSVTDGSTVGSTNDNTAFCGTSQTTGGVWYSVIGTGNTITASTCNNADYDTKITIFCQGCDNLVCVTGLDDTGGCGGFTTELSWCSQAGAEYLILIHGFGGATGNFTLTLSDDGVPCTASVGCAATGGCCFNDGSCTDLTADECDAAGGFYLGDGVPCTTGGDTLEFEGGGGPIPDVSSITNSQNVSGVGTITDLNVGVDITHTWVGDLCVILTSPANTQVTLIQRMGADLPCGSGCCGCSADNMNVTLDDAAASPIETQCVGNLSGTYSPENALSAFNGENADGNWTIEVNDGAGGDTGSLNGWTLIFPGSGGETNCPDLVDDVHLIIKQGACPAPVNPGSNGVTPMALIGSADLDVNDIDQSTLLIGRCDGTGGLVAPNDGPPGPSSNIVDLNHPEVLPLCGDDTCACNANQSSDGVDDLHLFFNTDEMAAAGILAGDQGDVIQLVVTGNRNDGSAFQAVDCVLLTQPGPAVPLVQVEGANPMWVDTWPLDLAFDMGGYTIPQFTRCYSPGEIVQVTAPATNPVTGTPFQTWRINGRLTAYRNPTLYYPVMNQFSTLEPVYMHADDPGTTTGITPTQGGPSPGGMGSP